ncbi:MAG: ferrous iron transporter B [Eubacteriales bacterium]
MTFALAGVPNCGKTLLFNRLTGGSYRTANRPGVTVEVRRGSYSAEGVRHTVLDLPGLYALSTCSAEEKVALDCLTGGEVDLIVAVVDALSPETGLRLCLELAGLNLPILIAFTRIDLLPNVGMTYDYPALSEALKIPVLPLCAKTGEGLERLPERLRSAKPCQVPQADDRENYRRIDEILSRVRIRQKRDGSLTDRLDRVLLHPVWGYPIFFLLIAALLLITFTLGGVPGDALTALVERSLPLIGNFLTPWVAKPLLSLLVDGILTGMLSVFSILPTLAILYFCLGLLEDSGYLTRVACLFDPIFGKMGLSGRAALPILLGLGCSVPAVLSTRTLEEGSDRRRVIRAIPFLPCSARLPVFLLLARTFFGKLYPLILLILYLVALLWTFGFLFLSFLLHKDEREPPALLLELPDYKIPSLTSILWYVRDRLWEGILRVGTVIFLSSILLWLLSSYGPGGRTAAEASFLALAGRKIAPLLAPCGLSDWRIAVAILSGLAGKELVISTLSVLLGGSGIGELAAMGFSPLQAFCLMVFVLLCFPCGGTLSAIRWETGSWTEALRAVLVGILCAWLASAVIFALFS